MKTNLVVDFTVRASVPKGFRLTENMKFDIKNAMAEALKDIGDDDETGDCNITRVGRMQLINIDYGIIAYDSPLYDTTVNNDAERRKLASDVAWRVRSSIQAAFPEVRTHVCYVDLWYAPDTTAEMVHYNMLSC